MAQSRHKLSEIGMDLKEVGFIMLKVEHFAFQFSDMNEAIRFYRETLGLKLLSQQLNERTTKDIVHVEVI